MTPLHILMTGNTSFKLANFRATLIKTLIADGHRVTVFVPFDEYTSDLCDMGCRVIELVMTGKGISPLEELRLLRRFFKTVGAEQPDVIFGYTIKNNIYGGLAARRNNIPFFPNVTGLGSAFGGLGLLRGLVTLLYKRAFAHASVVFVQNDADKFVLENAGIASTDQTRLLPGSGVDLEAFRAPTLVGKCEQGTTFILVSRMLKNKGINEFAQASKRLRDEGYNVTCQILGPVDDTNPDKVTLKELRHLERTCDVSYLGSSKDVRSWMEQADCVVLPSCYREGTPRVLLEAAAMARPIITTNTPGCRDTVEHGQTGFLVPPKDVDALFNRMKEFASLSVGAKKAMSLAARRRAEEFFDETIVVQAYQEQLNLICPKRQNEFEPSSCAF